MLTHFINWIDCNIWKVIIVIIRIINIIVIIKIINIIVIIRIINIIDLQNQ